MQNCFGQAEQGDRIVGREDPLGPLVPWGPYGAGGRNTGEITAATTIGPTLVVGGRPSSAAASGGATVSDDRARPRPGHGRPGRRTRGGGAVVRGRPTCPVRSVRQRQQREGVQTGTVPCQQVADLFAQPPVVTE
ncbi:hypothetical protein GCM10010260_55580 [Streptomyces filipinensis]|uniref:Uncharacterized protein n=1 Tax=Streptomyces filipinensis TaxID=66887 RepID=A0A918MCV0_9ACTN|nr:hypothetical protein GCM10010260_55580 [Streptomyces filipinensis]